ncbi:hypothetical protein B0H17DRAFT_1327964 [Mycena rosella]|uniref:Galactose oxidase n=1 Tax=Mycena rosella TaxID=1033263 RepID=A0AAD7DXX2_MYCRO|nr:hypothetical protein B0H17DRAFT_1327964 [Mycena rosella]
MRGRGSTSSAPSAPARNTVNAGYHPYRHYRATAAGSASAGTAPASANGGLVHTKSRLKGDKPAFNDWENLAVDHRREQVYSYGGVRPYDEDYTPTSDFYRLDLKTMTWENLTHALRFRPKNYIPDPFAENPEFELRALPALTEPAIDLVSLGGRSFLFLFGGHDSQGPTADLIAIDLDEYVWWFVDVQGTPIRSRMSASMVAIDNRLFVFGGRVKFDDKGPAIRTYSVAVYNPDTRWTWVISDTPMPRDLPPLGFSINATPVYGGQKILLTQGRIKNDKPIDLSRESTIFFHTQNYTFQDARTTMGTFPTGISWFKLGSVDAVPRPSTLASPRRPGRPPKNAVAEVVPASINFPPSAVMFGWVKHSPDSDNLVPEVWQYLLPPAEQIRCLNLGGMVWDLALDLQAFVSVGNRLFLLGSEEGRDAGEGEGDQMQVDKPLPCWDIAVEISSQYLIQA